MILIVNKNKQKKLSNVLIRRFFRNSNIQNKQLKAGKSRVQLLNVN
jgi:hypothetical protein